MTFEDGPSLDLEMLTEAYVENNRRRLAELITDDVAAWKSVREVTSGESKIYIQGTIERLEDLLAPITEIITRYRVTDPIDYTFIEEIGLRLDGAEVQKDLFGDGLPPEQLDSNIKEVIDELHERTVAGRQAEDTTS